MSLSIETNLVDEVLLADGWHKVEKKSFDLDAYEFVWEGLPDYTYGPGGLGFAFDEVDDAHPRGRQVSGPISAILAVRTRAAK